MVSRVEQSHLGNWWWTVDRWLLGSLLGLLMVGIVLSLAASPPVAERLGLSTFHFVNRQVLYAFPAVLLMIGVSLLSPRNIRRLALALFAASFVLVVATLFFGAEVKGARRWLNFPGITLQPSEFMKPAFVVLAAWAFSEGALRKGMPGTTLAFLLLGLAVVPLVLQPDMGQTILITLVWLSMLFLAGLHWFWVLASLPTLAMLGFAAYHFHDHFAERINKFLDPSSGDTFQVDTALESIVSGGWFGKGPGEGTVKRILPDSHTDFIFAVTAEEFGVLFCLALIGLFAFVVMRALTHGYQNRDAFCRLAACGLAILFGLQASINIMVNLHLIPSKGMTLPLISYGGSSLLSLALSLGMLLALTRRRPQAQNL